ncbi:MAG: hypothetical protein WCO13_00660 [Bacteroidota bacterium]
MSFETKNILSSLDLNNKVDKKNTFGLQPLNLTVMIFAYQSPELFWSIEQWNTYLGANFQYRNETPLTGGSQSHVWLWGDGGMTMPQNCFLNNLNLETFGSSNYSYFSENAFKGCVNLWALNSSSILGIFGGVFSGCTKLAIARMPSLTQLGSNNGTPNFENCILLNELQYANILNGNDEIEYLRGINPAILHPVLSTDEKIDLKVDKITGKGLSANDYTTIEKDKLAGINNHYRGTYTSVDALNAAVAVGNAGDEAAIDFGVGYDPVRYVWDVSDNVWKQGQGSSVTVDNAINNGSVNAVSGGAVYSGLGNKVDKVTGKGLSTNDYTTAEQTKVSNTSGTNTGDNATNTLYSGLDAAKRDKLTTFNNQTGTSYTLVLSDNGKHITFANASGIDVQIPLNSSVAFPVGTQIDCSQILAGKVTFGAGGGVTINSKGGLKAIGGQWVGVTLLKTATDVWSLFGDLIA